MESFRFAWLHELLEEARYFTISFSEEQDCRFEPLPIRL
jgi:hypothetical protein